MSNPADYRPRRSCLYMPGANARALERAETLPADMLILDLEDAVAPEAKAEARKLVRNAVSEEVYGPREVIIRINGLDTEWGLADLGMATAAGPDGVLVPKVTSAEEILAIDQTLSNSSASPELGLWVSEPDPRSRTAGSRALLWAPTTWPRSATRSSRLIAARSIRPCLWRCWRRGPMAW